MWWVTFLGMLLIPLLGGMLALVATMLPRWLSRWEGREVGRAPLQAARPSPAASPAEPVPIPKPAEPVPAPQAVESEDALVAAAIALALRFYQEEAAPLPEMAPTAGTGSPWAMSGRWQAMQSRLNVPKR